MRIFDPSIARAARAYTGLKQIELAKRAKVASRTIYKLENDGQVTPESLERILQALDGLGVTINFDEAGRVYGLTFGKHLKGEK